MAAVSCWWLFDYSVFVIGSHCGRCHPCGNMPVQFIRRRISLYVHGTSVIFVNENENENGEKRENNKFVNEN